MRFVIVFLALLASCGTSPKPREAENKPAAYSDLVQYAMASCFAFQANGYLKDQGERWAGAIMQNARGSVEKWTPVADAVKVELSRSGLAQGQGEGPQAPTVPLPVMTCGQIADAPAVHQAIQAARKALEGDYVAKLG